MYNHKSLHASTLRPGKIIRRSYKYLLEIEPAAYSTAVYHSITASTVSIIILTIEILTTERIPKMQT